MADDPYKVHIRDQAAAAAAQVATTFSQIEVLLKAANMHDRSDRIDPDRVMAMVRRCKLCEHLKVPGVSPQPVYCLLMLDRIDCERCFHADVPVIHAMAPTSQTCDECKEFVPSNIFAEIVIRSGPMVILGSRGPCCFTRPDHE